MDLNTYKLGELAKIKYGKNQAKVIDVNGKIPILGTGGLMGYANDYLYNKPSVLIGRKGSIKNIYYIKTPFWTVDTLFYTEINDDIVYPHYFYYALSLIDFDRYNEGTTIPSLRTETLNRIDIKIPAKSTQLKILSVIEPIEEKIAINNSINDNLLSQVMSLYKHIFKESNEERKTCRADEYFSIAIGKTPPRKERDWFSFDSSNVKWVSISDMGNCVVFIFDSSEYLVHEAVKKFNIAVIPENTVLLSFKLTVGRVAITDGIMTTNEAIAHFKTQDTRINPYLYCYLKDYNYQSLGSTSSIATAVNSKIIKAMPFIIPNDTELQKFNDIALPAFETIKNNQLENKRLTELRDSILPKLMSGEIDVSEIRI